MPVLEPRAVMTRRSATTVALIATLIAYFVIAWFLSGIEIPPEARAAFPPWMRPFGVVATLGLVVTNAIGVPAVAAQLLAAIILGSVLGAIFGTVRHLLQR
jgi:hypothetical protein